MSGEEARPSESSAKGLDSEKGSTKVDASRVLLALSLAVVASRSDTELVGDVIARVPCSGQGVWMVASRVLAVDGVRASRLAS